MRNADEGPVGAVPAFLAGGFSVLNEEETVWDAMLSGWRSQQFARNLSFATVENRRSVVCRFQEHAGTFPWSWTAPEVDEFFLEFRAIRAGSHSTLLSYQNALRMFLEYVVDPAYGWVELCWERFGDHPVQVFHEWNTARHTQQAMAGPSKRPYTRAELQDLFDCADERVVRIRRSGSKGWVPAFRLATMMKTAYAWGLRRNEVRMLDLVDLAANPAAHRFGDAGIVYVRHGKAMKGSPPKRRSVLTVPEFEWAVGCLAEWIEEGRPRLAALGASWIWPSERGGHTVSANWISTAFTEVRQEAGLDDGLDFHSLRRSYVTHLIEGGYDAFFVQQQVGHEHGSTTSIYTGLSPDYRARVVNDALTRTANAALNRRDPK